MPEEEFKRVLTVVAEEIDMIPIAADVVPVVRCRECKHYREIRTKRHKNLIYRCTRMGKNDMDYPVKPDDFCSCGELKKQKAVQTHCPTQKMLKGDIT